MVLMVFAVLPMPNKNSSKKDCKKKRDRANFKIQEFISTIKGES